MRTSVLLILSLHVLHGQSIDCANNATTESKSQTGPGGVVAVLSVHTEDDHSKNSHECMASYYIRITPADARNDAATTTPSMGFTNSIGEWGRRLSLHLDGFSADGRHIFGVISEGGKYSSVTVFDFNIDGSHEETQVKHGLSRLSAVNCGTSFAVAGTTGHGEFVLETNTANPCRNDHRWLLDKTGTLRDMPKDQVFVTLYRPQPR